MEPTLSQLYEQFNQLLNRLQDQLVIINQDLKELSHNKIDKTACSEHGRKMDDLDRRLRTLETKVEVNVTKISLWSGGIGAIVSTLISVFLGKFV